MDSKAPQQNEGTSPNGIQHMPRRRAVSPGFSASFEPEPIARPAGPSPSTSAEEAIIQTRASRYGPAVIKFGCYSGAVAVAYTYANGFYLLYNKNKAGWASTFRHRLLILSPLMAMYACGNGVVPMPFKRHFERMLGRPALSTMDMYKAKDTLLKHQAAASNP